MFLRPSSTLMSLYVKLLILEAQENNKHMHTKKQINQKNYAHFM